MFLSPTLENLSDPFLLRDMEKAVERIFIAVQNKEKILVFGDFDADGVSATALVHLFFEYIDANVSWYVPHRIKEGYSLQSDHIKMASDKDVDLIITVDCGISSHEAVKEAKLEDIDVIITDHHEPDLTLPCAAAIIDPKRKDWQSRGDFLSGVGVAFFLVMALRKFFRDKGFWENIKEPNLSNYLDLFAIGTIADMVPLIHENRALCIAGLKKIRQGKRLGIRSLALMSAIDLKQLDSDDISFKIVPRITAAGRISHARICVSQLTSTDIGNADETAFLLNRLNKKRQEIERSIISDIERILIEKPDLLNTRLLFLWNDNWDPSVLGIVASNLSRKYYCPVILLSTASEYAVGSGRSINDINIYQALRENETLLEKFGGHTMASGLTVKKDNLHMLCQNLKQHMQDCYSKESFKKTLAIDAVLDFEDINFNLAREIHRLMPFGTANPKPVFLCEKVQVQSSFVFANNHRKMVLKSALLTNSSHQVEAVHFNIENPNDQPGYYSKIAFELMINKFKSNAAQMLIKDI